MNKCDYQQSALVGCVGVRDMNISMVSNGVVCPKPRSTGFFNFILTEGNYDMETSYFEMASSPPSRVSNPLIQDSQFNNDNFVPIISNPEEEEEEAAAAAATNSPPPSFMSASAGKNGGGCVTMKFGNKPAAVRIEGFNCRSSISAVA